MTELQQPPRPNQCKCGEPISELDNRLDDLVCAIWAFGAEEVAQVGTHFQQVWAQVDINSPESSDHVAAIHLWETLTRVAQEIQNIREEHGRGST